MTYYDMKQACYAQIELSDKILADVRKLANETKNHDIYSKCKRFEDRITAFVADVVYPYLADELNPAYQGQPANASHIEGKLHSIEQKISIGFKGEWESLKKSAK